MDEIKKKIFASKVLEQLSAAAMQLQPGRSLLLRGAAGSTLAFAAARLYSDLGDHVLVLASDEDRAERLRDDCASLAGESRVRYFGARPTHQSQLLDMTSPIAQIETLKALTGETKLIVIASPQSIIEKVPPPDRFKTSIIEISAGAEIPFQNLLTELEHRGFERKDFVETYGDVAVRGGILDVFPFVGENPLRFEFWGDSVESIREFDVLSQRSIRELKAASIVPSLTTPAPTNADGDEIESRPANLSATLFDYLGSGSLVVVDEPAAIEREISERINQGASNVLTYDEVSSRIRRQAAVISGRVARQADDAAAQATIDMDASSQPSFNGSISHLVSTLEQLSSDGYQLYLTADTKDESKRLRELIEGVGTSPHSDSDETPSDQAVESLQPFLSGVRFLTETIHSGFILPSEKLAVFTEHEIFNRLKRRGLQKRKRFKGISQKELQQLRRGDPVVHIDHGIGTFAGLTKIRVGGVEQEVMKLLFAEDDTLYVNLNFINRVQKYSSQEGHVPKLSKLGAPDWDRAKAKAKKKIKDIARDIIALYARRKHEHGFAFSPDSHWQRELEASFMYEDTPDQAQATAAVKLDMESSSPMDRLICGDVGFGKTEIAVRAAFKAVLDGKQVAILVPTTILALQHFNTFQDRLSRYTTRVEHLTRFKSAKDQKRIVEDLHQGKVDIIIGTHRLLSKDIGFKDLGLLVIDEEHRFGVTAKEKLRKLKATVDTLTLTATPIPRTLHFSLIGARDLSLINTPPRNRLPIVTEIIAATEGREAHWRIVREAIVRELHRGGQIYFVHDRVQNIETIANQVKKHVPEARVHVAHGQMPGHELEKTMLDFLERRYDVLLATKIIESGLDIPNVNTIIINRADRFGMAELYQLRGRVGRSNVQAYAYLLVPPLSLVPKHTLRRLQAIEEFTELGSGFNLAMRDLEIRGAGNIFGAEQSGVIMEMGFEMYERIVREAVEELKQDEFKEVFQDKPKPQATDRVVETVVDADIEALIPDFYIQSDAERLDIYRRLYRAATAEELQQMRDEVRDRFGEYPPEVENLFLLVGLRITASRAGFPKLSLQGSTLTVTLPDQSNEKYYGTPNDPSAQFQRLMKKIADAKRSDVQLRQIGAELALQFTKISDDGVADRIEAARKRVEEMERT